MNDDGYQGDRQEGGASGFATGLSSDDGAASVSTLRASIPSAEDYRLIVARWKGKEALLDEFCAARPAAGSGRVARRMEDVGPIRYWPRLAKRNVEIADTGSLYETRREALSAAKEYRQRCRLIQSARFFFEGLDRLAAQGMPREARRRCSGSGPLGLASPVGNADAPVPNPITDTQESG